MEKIVVGISDTVVTADSVTAPASAGSFSGSQTPPAGVYKIQFWYELTGTTEVALANARLKANNVNLITTLPSITGGGWVTGVVERVTLNGINPVFLGAGAAATAGAQYSGIVACTRVE